MLTPPIAKLWPLRICARFSSGAFGSKFAAVGDVLADRDFGDRLVGGVDDRQQALAVRRRPRQRQPGNLRELGAAGDHRVGRADAGDDDGLDLEAVLFPEIEAVGDVAGDERKADRRHRHRHLFDGLLRVQRRAARAQSASASAAQRAARIIRSARASSPAPPGRRGRNS